MGAPRERLPARHDSCVQLHGAFVQMCLAFCATKSKFWTKWVHWWNHWAMPAQWWLQTTSNHEKWLCAHLLIPHALVQTFP